jgi:hypothetical protein
MDRVSKDQFTWVEELIDCVNKDLPEGAAFQFFSPQRAFRCLGRLSGLEALGTKAINDSAVLACSSFVLHYMSGIETWGCPMELMLATMAHKPVIVWTEGDYAQEDLPLYLQACLNNTNIAITGRVEGVRERLINQYTKTDMDNVLTSLICSLKETIPQPPEENGDVSWI